ncbi:MAG: FecR family protein, partial [Proteobacteria bacterium]|nr:FecR family protein [Pseudomonadota bacterium]MBU4327388.1 FecR family protein [Pseudomonadota bacterium]
MKREYLLKMLLFWMVICLPVWAGAEDLGFLRLSQMEGDVQIQSKDLTEWTPATINLPVQEGDRLWVPKDAWVQVETREGNVLRLDADSALEILAVDEESLQVYLSQGQAYLNFKKVNNSMLQVDTPVSSIRIYDSSTLNVALAENGNTEISVFRGAVFAENRTGEVRVGAGKMLSMDDELPTLMALAPPDDWERWNKEWDESLSEGEGSEQYLPQELSGYGRDLNRNGRWVETQEYGYVWTPTTDISADWAPYRHGRWVWIGGDYVWIASEPWGWAPYHYGRWSHISSHGWCWVPPPRHEVYWGPGYVSWVSTNTDVAWVPLAPGEIYYGHGHYGPHSVNIVDVDISAVVPGRNYRNVHVRNAVSVVHRDAFLRG